MALAVSIFCVVIYMGQACQINGGGYGGFKGREGGGPGTPPAFDLDGTYAEGEKRSPVSFPSAGSTAGAGGYNPSEPYNNSFFSFSKTPVCSSGLPSALGEVGSVVAGLISGSSSGGFFHRASACSASVLISSESITSYDFDPISWIYQNKVYTRYTAAPTQVSDIMRTVGHCVAVDAPNADNIDTGTSATVYRKGTALYASVYRGIAEGGLYQRYHMGPIEVLGAEGEASAVYSTFGFNLQINASVSGVTGTGVFKASWNNSLLALNMNCWRFED